MASIPELAGSWCSVAASLAIEAGDAEAAANHIVEAARRATADGALNSAIGLLERADSLELPIAGRLKVKSALIDAFAAAGRIDEAARVTAVVIRERASLSVADAMIGVAHLRLARVAASGARWELADMELTAARNSGLAPDNTVEADVVEALILRGRHHSAAAGEIAERAAEHAIAVGRPDLACEALFVKGQVARLVDLDEAERIFAKAHRLALVHGLALAETSALHELGTIDLLATGRTERLEAALDRAERSGAVISAAVLNLQLSVAYFNAGAFVAARTSAATALADSITLGLGELRTMATCLVAESAAIEGHDDTLDAAIRAFTDSERRHDPDAYAGLIGTGRGVRCLLVEERAAALAQFETALEIVTGAAELRPQPWWGMLALVRALDGGDAATIIEQIESGSPVTWRGNEVCARWARAVCAGRAGDRAAATTLAATIDATDNPSPWQGMLARRLAAEAALADGWGEPRRWLHDVGEFFRSFPAPLVADACARLLDEIVQDDDAVPHWLASRGVTRREFAVLDLLTDGLSNRELAARLYISPRTVEKHVESLCRKLNVHSRAQLVAAAHRLALER